MLPSLTARKLFLKNWLVWLLKIIYMSNVLEYFLLSVHSDRLGTKIFKTKTKQKKKKKKKTSSLENQTNH